MKVAYAPNQAEAEMIQGLLSQHDIPSMLRPVGLDTPGVLPFGPLDVLVAEEDADLAREVLAGTPGAI